MPWHQLHLSHRGQMEKLLMENMSSSLASQRRELSSKQVVSLIPGMTHSGCAEGQDIARKLPAPFTFQFPKPWGLCHHLICRNPKQRTFFLSYVHIWVSTFPLQRRRHFWNELKPKVLLFLAHSGKLYSFFGAIQSQPRDLGNSDNVSSCLGPFFFFFFWCHFVTASFPLLYNQIKHRMMTWLTPGKSKVLFAYFKLSRSSKALLMHAI